MCVGAGKFETKAKKMAGNHRIPPPIPGHRVPKEYVRQQLNVLNIKNVTEEELEAYAADLTKLIQKNLVGTDVGSSSDDMPEATTSRSPPAPSPKVNQVHGSPQHSKHKSPQSPHHSIEDPGSAVFKTFPGDENRVDLLSPSLSPSPVRGRCLLLGKETTGLNEGNVMLPGYKDNSSSSPSSRRIDTSGKKRNVFMKRKVLRKLNGESRVVDESMSEYDSDVDKSLTRYLFDLSLTSVSTSDASSDPNTQPPRCCKSFIRPPTSHPHTRGLKKCDPVNRYHQFREMWEDFRPPGENPRNSLRWHIREQLMHQDVPFYEPQRRVYRPNEYVVPTEKKRSALRWEVRHALAHQ